jgi:hypothetical protein
VISSVSLQRVEKYVYLDHQRLVSSLYQSLMMEAESLQNNKSLFHIDVVVSRQTGIAFSRR